MGHNRLLVQSYLWEYCITKSIKLQDDPLMYDPKLSVKLRQAAHSGDNSLRVKAQQQSKDFIVIF